MKKLAYTVQMSFDVPDSEKRVAEKASELFSLLNSKLKLESNHLDILANPFRSIADSIDNKEVLKQRIVLRNFRDQTQKNFEDILRLAHKSSLMMNEFGSDTETVEMMNSFTSEFMDLEKLVNTFLSLFSNIGNDGFMSSIILSVDAIKKEIAQIKQLINDRIINHIDSNILAKKWKSSVIKEDENDVYEKVPLIVQLYKERQEALK